MTRKKFSVGDKFLIQVSSEVRAIAIFGLGGDFLFFDEAENLEKDSIPFLRLMVSYPSIRRANWEPAGSIVVNEAERSTSYIQEPVGGEKLLYDPVSGTSKVWRGEGDEKFEKLAAWDARDHISKILEYRYFGCYDPIVGMLSADVRAS